MGKYIKRGLPIVITLLLVWFLLRNGIQWSDLRSILHQAQWRWLALTLVWTLCAYGAVTWLNAILLQRFSSKVPYGKQFLTQLAMAFIETVVPSVAISGIMLRVRLLKPYGVSADIATATSLVETTLLSAILILPALLVTFVILVEGIQGFGLLNPWLFFIIGIVTLIGIVIWQWNTATFVNFRARGIQNAAHFWDQTIQRRWPKYFGDWPAQRVINRFQYLWSESIASVQARPYAILSSLLMHFVFEALCLVTCFYALGQRLPLTTLLLLYPLTIAINTLGAVPGGVGLAEVSLSAFYAQFGITIEVAVAAALAYRLTSYWFPRVAGGLAWLWMEHTNPGLSMMERPL